MGKTSTAGMKNPKVMAQAKDAIQRITGTTEVQFCHDLPQEEKISHALQTLLNIETPEGSSLWTYRSTLDLIVVAWNISLQPAEDQPKLIQEIVGKIAGPNTALQREGLAHLGRMIISKQVFFPDDKRLVVSWEVKSNGPKMSVSAAALMPPSDEPDMLSSSDVGPE